MKISTKHQVDRLIEDLELKNQALTKILLESEKARKKNFNQPQQVTNIANPNNNLIKFFSAMKAKFFTIRFIVFLTIASAFILSVDAQTFENGVMKGVVRVKLDPKLVTAQTGIKPFSKKGIVYTGIQQLDNVNTSIKSTSVKRVFAYSEKFEERHRKYGLHLWYEIQYSEALSATEVAKAYAGVSGVIESEPVYEKKLIDKVLSTQATDVTAWSGNFNDPYLPDQWHYNNTGQTGGTIGADINLYEAWETSTGSPKVIVSVHDVGIDYSHEDLASNMWVNQAEFNGTKGVDDDGNGYLDDIYGFNFVDNYGEITPGDHATHVAGIIGAVNNNGIGISGIAGGTNHNDGVKLMSCQIIGGYARVEESFIYAADNGAVISQNSWGYSYPGSVEQVVLDAIDYFIAEAGNFSGSLMKGGVVIFAAGNANWDADFWPGYYENVISVSALNHNNVKAEYSNYGSWVDIAAPGGDYSNGIATNVLSTLANNNYGYMEGTSMACPHVSGVAALVVAANNNQNFTNTALKNHLLTAYRLIDTITANESFAGKLGIGVIDAALAVAFDSGIAPNAIANLNVTGTSQDFATLQWSVPADGDDDKPIGFEVLYSLQNITPATIQFAKTKLIDNSQSVGILVNAEVNALIPLSTYFFAVRSIDRWGNISNLSNIVSANTNEGPNASVDRSDLSIHIDASVSLIGSDTINLLNSGQGILRWTADARHVSQIDQYNNTHIHYPKLKQPLGDKRISVSSNELTRENKIVPMGQQYEYNELNYCDYSRGLFILGETNLNYTNSSATRFFVTDANGFNLTQVQALLKQDNVFGPIVLEVYLGESIYNSRLVYAQEVYSYSKTEYQHSIDLEEQLFFQQGEYFWLVFHVPAGNLYPLGAGFELATNHSNNCFFSLNLGQSWQRLEDVYWDNRLVWAVTAISQYKTLGEYISILPDNGDIASAGAQHIEVSVDASNLVSGIYNSNIVLQTNEPEEQIIRIPINLTITGRKPIITSNDITDFGGILYGNEKTVDIAFQNEGYGPFENIAASISDSQFTIVGSPPYSISARSEQMISITFKPSAPGNSNAVLTLSDDKGNTFTFSLFGVAAQPPVIAISPADTTISGLSIGDTVTSELYLINQGNYPLKYYFPSFADGSNIDQVDKYISKFGYSSSIDTALFEWNEISSNGTKVTDEFKIDAKRFSDPVSLGFSFPFFGKPETQVFITDRFLLSFDQNTTFNVSPIRFKDQYSPDRFIGAIGLQFYPEVSGDVYYKCLPDRFIVEYKNAAMYYSDPVTWQLEYVNIDVQMVLFDNGDIGFFYNNVSSLYNSNEFNYGAYIGIEDQNIDDGLRVYDQNSNYQDGKFCPIDDSAAVIIKNPGMGIVKQLDNSFGTIQPGDSVMVNYTIETSALWQDNFTERLSIVSNDPFNNPVYSTIHLNITSGGLPEVCLNTDTLNFGDVFQTGKKALSFIAINSGSLAVDIDTMYFVQNDYVISNGQVPIELKAKHSLIFEISVLTATLGVKNDILIIKTNDGDSLQLSLLGEIIEAPIISVDLTTINETLNHGDSTLLNFTVNNTGGNNLEISPVGNDWLTVSTTKQPISYNYSMSSGKELNGPVCNWVDILQTGTEHSSTLDPFDPQKLWGTLALPFPFKFYGIDYDTIYFTLSGLLSFDNSNGSDLAWGPPNTIPSMELPNNFISPLWAFGGPAYKVYFPDAGIYTMVFSDKVVITYQDFLNNFGMGDPVSFQAILYADGKIKFQYNITGSDITSNLALIGIENQDGTKGKQASYRQWFVTDDLAIIFIPADTYEVEPAASATFDLKVSAKELYGGTYQGKLAINNNTPDTANYEIPASLTVIGEPILEAPAHIQFDTIFVYDTIDDWGMPIPKSHIREFLLKNTGTSLVSVSSIYLLQNVETVAESYVCIHDPWFGLLCSWADISTETFPVELRPGEQKSFRVRITPTGSNINLNDTLIIQSNALVNELKIPVSAFVSLPPVLNIQDNIITVIAHNSSHQENRSLNLDNTAGSANLNYSLSLKFERTGSEPSAASLSAVKTLFGESAKAPMLQSTMVSSNQVISKMSPVGYNRVLEYDTASTAANSVGYGGEMAFHSATAFYAPANGFNLTHVMNYVVPRAWLNSRITLEILSGTDNINNAIVLASQTVEHNISSPDNTGSFLTIKLDESISFYPNEKFYVVFRYPLGLEFPQGLGELVVPSASNRFFFGDGKGWYDLIGQGFDELGWMVKALEEEANSGSWVEITSALSGTIVPGGSVDVGLAFDAEWTQPGDNTAKLEINTNDPKNLKGLATLKLLRNKAPEFKNAPALKLYATEGVVSNYTIEATDLEADAFEYALEGSVEYLTSAENNGKFELTFSPGFDAAAQYNFNVSATDTNGNKSLLPVSIQLTNVNRAPVAISALDDVTLYLATGIEVIPTKSMFTDPDGDDYTVTGIINDNSIAELFSSESSVALQPLTLGNTFVTLYVTDSHGAATNASFNVGVQAVSGTREIAEDGFEVFPNPATDVFKVMAGNTISGLVTIYIIDSRGNTVSTITTQKEETTIDIRNLPEGIYTLQIINGKNQVQKVFIKK